MCVRISAEDVLMRLSDCDTDESTEEEASNTDSSDDTAVESEEENMEISNVTGEQSGYEREWRGEVRVGRRGRGRGRGRGIRRGRGRGRGRGGTGSSGIYGELGDVSSLWKELKNGK